jgi:hypothetical protein
MASINSSQSVVYKGLVIRLCGSLYEALGDDVYNIHANCFTIYDHHDRYSNKNNNNDDDDDDDDDDNNNNNNTNNNIHTHRHSGKETERLNVLCPFQYCHHAQLSM